MCVCLTKLSSVYYYPNWCRPLPTWIASIQTGQKFSGSLIDGITIARCSSVPDNVEDETAGCIHFADEFTNRYGGCHPEFFPGSLDEAVKEACLRPAKDRRLLAVYLHHDGSVLSNVFCTQLLGFESVLQCLNAHFVVWGWDLTHESNRHK
uniref:UAS domain-containing protein n=3 Tax=Timema TaxID=61471 RepID=A0A7R9HH17_TIMPO|nr:unnamed protein product [Timema poppensis]